MASDIMIVKGNPNMSHWTLEKGYDDTADEKSYPIRVFNARHSAALTVTLLLYDRDLEYMCRGPIQGFKVILHTPGQILKTSRHSFRVPLSEEAEIWITPKLITTSDELRDYEPSRRKCFFSTEHQLRFFTIYTQNNCEAECLANFTKMECQCVTFSMPSKCKIPQNNSHVPLTRSLNLIPGERSTKVCGASSVKCYRNAEKKLFGEDIIDGLTDYTAKSFRQNCNCLPTCTSIIYDADIDRARFDWKATLKAYKVPIDAFAE